MLSASAAAVTLSADEIITAFWFAQSRGIRMRWSPALLAKLAKLSKPKWKEEPYWLKVFPLLSTWRVIED